MPILPKKILLLRLSSIGDIVLTTPVIRCLKLQLPDVHLHFLVKKNFATIVHTNPYINKVHLFEGDLKQCIQELKKEQFDCIIDLHNNQRTWLIKQALRVKNYTFNKLNIEKWLLIYLKWNKLPDVHIVDRYLAAVAPLGVQNDGKGLDYFIPEKDRVKPTQLFPELHHQSYTALVIGAKHATKRLPMHKLVAICQLLRQPVILLGGPSDAVIAQQIVEQVGQPSVFSACGLLNLSQSASLVQQAAKVITHDTGLMHIAAAFNQHILCIWGNTVPEFGMYPYLANDTKGSFHIVQVDNLPCRPCSKIGYEQCPKQHFHCMERIPVQAIAGWGN